MVLFPLRGIPHANGIVVLAGGAPLTVRREGDGRLMVAGVSDQSMKDIALSRPPKLEVFVTSCEERFGIGRKDEQARSGQGPHFLARDGVPVAQGTVAAGQELAVGGKSDRPKPLPVFLDAAEFLAGRGFPEFDLMVMGCGSDCFPIGRDDSTSDGRRSGKRMLLFARGAIEETNAVQAIAGGNALAVRGEGQRSDHFAMAARCRRIHPQKLARGDIKHAQSFVHGVAADAQRFSVRRKSESTMMGIVPTIKAAYLLLTLKIHDQHLLER